MRLFILRHGQAETFAASDAERELTAAGREEVARVIRKSAGELAAVTKLWVSPLKRAQQTADVVIATLGDIPRETTRRLLPQSTPAEVLELLSTHEMLSAHEDSACLLVSHMPLVGELVNNLCGKARGYYAMNTGALANIELADFEPAYPALASGHLTWLR